MIKREGIRFCRKHGSSLLHFENTREATLENLIYDVGLFDGSDTAYYLARGYNVVAIDANPVFIESAKERFCNQVSNGRLTLINVGIGPSRGSATFWISDHADWSSFDRLIASRDGTAHRPITVPTIPFADILSDYGTPHYLKIDIEGCDRLCIEALRGKMLPRFISAESECVSDHSELSDDEATSMLRLLHDVGYKGFKLINQYYLLPQQLVFTDREGIANIWLFNAGATGPWGNDIPGGWMSFDVARTLYLRSRHKFFETQRPLYSFWYDWHATY